MYQVSFPNLGYLQENVPLYLIDQLREIVKEKDLPKQNSKLVGHIRKEFEIPKAVPIFQDYLVHLANTYQELFKYYTPNTTDKKMNFKLKSMWVNFQKKHEFNPLHTHGGAFSFVIWLQVPYFIKDEQEQGPGKESNHNVSGAFEFYYTTALGGIINHTIPVDKTYEGVIAFFPARLSHIVYPFYTSDDYRISVSGNVVLDTDQIMS